MFLKNGSAENNGSAVISRAGQCASGRAMHFEQGTLYILGTSKLYILGTLYMLGTGKLYILGTLYMLGTDKLYILGSALHISSRAVRCQ